MIKPIFLAANLLQRPGWPPLPGHERLAKEGITFENHQVGYRVKEKSCERRISPGKRYRLEVIAFNMGFENEGGGYSILKTRRSRL